MFFRSEYFRFLCLGFANLEVVREVKRYIETV